MKPGTPVIYCDFNSPNDRDYNVMTRVAQKSKNKGKIWIWLDDTEVEVLKSNCQEIRMMEEGTIRINSKFRFPFEAVK